MDKEVHLLTLFTHPSLSVASSKLDTNFSLTSLGYSWPTAKHSAFLIAACLVPRTSFFFSSINLQMTKDVSHNSKSYVHFLSDGLCFALL